MLTTQLIHTDHSHTHRVWSVYLLSVPGGGDGWQEDNDKARVWHWYNKSWRGVWLDFHFPRHLDCSQPSSQLASVHCCHCWLQGLSYNRRDNFLQLWPEYCVYCAGEKFRNLLIHSEFCLRGEWSVNTGLLVSTAPVLFRQVHKNPKIASAPALANSGQAQLRENQTINNKPGERENTLALKQQPENKQNHERAIPVCFLVPVSNNWIKWSVFPKLYFTRRDQGTPWQQRDWDLSISVFWL